MRWLYQLFFLGRFTWPRFRRSKQQGKIVYKTELNDLVKLLGSQLQETVFCNIDGNGRAIIGTASETIAYVTLLTKGNRKQYIYIVVRLQDGYEMHKAWFQLAFMAFKVRFRKPTLILKKIAALPPRGH